MHITHGENEEAGQVPIPRLSVLTAADATGIMDEFSENPTIDKIEIWNTDETQLCDTVFIIDGEYLVYYGTGNFVFCAVKLDAVG